MRWLLIVLGVIVALVAVVYGVGASLPVAHVASVRVHLHAPPESVFTAISDPASAAEWRSDIEKVEILPPSGERPRWRETTSMGPIILVAEEVQPPLRFVTRIDDPEQPFGGRWIHVLEPIGAGTRVTITEEGEVYDPFFRFMSRFIFGHHATLERYARDLARRFGSEGVVESGDPGP